MTTNNITVIYKAPAREACILTISNDLSSYQNLVGGYIETVPLFTWYHDGYVHHVIMIVNEEGCLLGLPTQTVFGMKIAGPAVICELKWDHVERMDDFTSIHRETVRLIRKTMPVRKERGFISCDETL